MQEIVKKELCSGCHACYNICPKHCIEMKYDAEGFLYPEINQNECVNCGKCKNVCPILKEYKGNPKVQAYACINKDDDIRMKSSSGGVFRLLAEYVIEQNGVVYGAAFDDELNIHHIGVDNKEELYKLQGSKYVQSRIGDTYSKIKDLLEQNRLVLFTGTPCQISGLKSYLKKEYDNLVLQDLICHGVPSPMVWQRYLRYQEHKNNAKIDKNKMISFRSKNDGWKKYHVVLPFENNRCYDNLSGNDNYIKAFLHNLCLRPSCYNCHSKSLERESDITLADFWGIEKVLPEMFDDKGTSLVLVNSKKGKMIFDAIANNLKYREVDIDEAAKYNSAAYKSAVKNKARDKYMREIVNGDFEKVTEKYTKEHAFVKLKSKIKMIIKRVVK